MAHRSYTLRSLAALVGFGSLVACGPAQAPRPLYPALTTERGARRIREISDLEDVRDVAALGGSHYVATDNGLLVYGEGDVPQRFGVDAGFASADLTALLVEPAGGLLVAANEQLFRFAGERATAVEGAPAMRRVMDLARVGDATYVCSLSGVFRLDTSGISRVGDPVSCTTLAPTPENTLWIGTSTGLLYLDEQNNLRDHGASSGIPETFVRSVAPVGPGQALALVQGAQTSQLAFYDGAAWHAYTVPGWHDGERAAGLVSHEGRLLLLTSDRAIQLAPSGPGQALTVLGTRPASVRTRSAELTPAASVTAPAEVELARLVRLPQPMTDEGRARGGEAPRLVMAPVDVHLPTGALRASTNQDVVFAAIANGGAVVLGAHTSRRLRSMTLVSPEDLQVVSDASSGVWVRGRDGDISKWMDGRLRRLALPADMDVQCLVSGPEGAYVLAFARGTHVIHVYVVEEQGLRHAFERTLDPAIVALPFGAVARDGRVWAGVRVRGERSERMRGAVVFSSSSEEVVYHHRGASQEAGGLVMPDEVSALSFDILGNTWFASLGGAVRVEEHQAIVFDGTRGVQGDVVTDIAPGDQSRMWIAAAEGLGSYYERRFDFFLPEVVRTHRPVALALEVRGAETILWGAGRYGLVAGNGTTWQAYDATSGLPTTELRDIEVDAQGRLWLLAADRVFVVER